MLKITSQQLTSGTGRLRRDYARKLHSHLRAVWPEGAVELADVEALTEWAAQTGVTGRYDMQRVAEMLLEDGEPIGVAPSGGPLAEGLSRRYPSSVDKVDALADARLLASLDADGAVLPAGFDSPPTERDRLLAQADAAARARLQRRHPWTQAQGSPSHESRLRTDPLYRTAFRELRERELAARMPTSAVPGGHDDVLVTNVLACPREPLRVRISRFVRHDVWRWLQTDAGEDVYAELDGPAAGENLKPLESDPSYGAWDPTFDEADPDVLTPVPLSEGYAYVFAPGNAQGGQYELLAAFRVSGGGYARFDARRGATEPDGIGPARPYMQVERYFNAGTPAFDDLRIVDSDVPLSDARLFSHRFEALVRTVHKRGHRVVVSQPVLDAGDHESLGDSAVVSSLRARTGATAAKYQHQVVPLDGQPGVSLRRVDVPAETARLAGAYRSAFTNYHSWLDHPERSEEAFLSQTLTALVEQRPALARRIDDSRWQAWKFADELHLAVSRYYLLRAAGELAHWLRSAEFRDWLVDANLADDEAHHAWADEVFADAIHGAQLHPETAAALAEMVADLASYFNLRIGFSPHAAAEGPGAGGNPYDTLNSAPTAHQPSGIPEVGTHRFNAMRKLNHTGVSILTDFAPVLVRYHGGGSAKGFVARLTGVVATRVRAIEVEVLDYNGGVRRLQVGALNAAIDAVKMS